MKTRESLNESELALLDLFENYKLSALTKDTEAYEIGKKIAENLNTEMWKPSKKEWVFNSDTTYETRFLYNLERHCHTEKEAKRRLKMELELNIINSYILEANKNEPFILHWSGPIQIKYYIVFNHVTNKFYYDVAHGRRIFGVEYCTKNTATKLCQMLNDGLIDGINND